LSLGAETIRVPTGKPVRATSGAPAAARVGLGGRARRRSALAGLTGGGTDGNEQLTAMTGVVLIVLLAVIGVTILRIGQLISVHLFVGLLLIGPVALKLASTGYRFARYYTHEPRYHRKGPPHPALRMIAPVVVLSTVVVFVSGVVLMFDGPLDRDPLLLIHKVSFIVWVAFTALHVLGHLPGFGHALRATRAGDDPAVGRADIGSGAGEAGRWIAMAGALVAGVVLAIVLIPDFAAWTAHSLGHHH
jgi:hypothetical protein